MNKFLLITQNFWPENFIINDFVIELKKIGYDIDVVTAMPNYPNGKIYKEYKGKFIYKELFNNIRIYRSIIYPDHSTSKYKRIFSYLSFVASLSLNLLRVLFNKYDFVFVFQPGAVTVGFPALIFKFIKRIPMFFWTQDLWPEALWATKLISKDNPVSKILAKISSFIYRRSDILLTQSPAYIDILKNYNIPIEKIKYLPNYPYNKTDKIVHSKTDKAFNIVFTGNLGLAQDLMNICEIARLLKENSFIKFYLIGNGLMKEEIKSFISQNDLKNISVVDGMPPGQLIKYYEISDLLLLSLNNDDNLNLTIPSKLQNYLSLGLPILGIVKGAAAKIILESNSGFVLEPSNPELALREILNICKLDKKILKEKGDNGYKYYLENFTREKVVSNFNNYVKEFINEK